MVLCGTAVSSFAANQSHHEAHLFQENLIEHISDCRPAGQLNHCESGSGKPSILKPVPSHHLIFDGLIRFYQLAGSGVRGTICPMFPHCSRYARQVFRNHNPFKAWFMTADRLIRCGSDPTQYPNVLIGGQNAWVDLDSPSFGFEYFANYSRPLPQNMAGISATATNMVSKSNVPNTFSTPETQYEFAAWLQKSYFYDRAITEFLRFCYLYPESNLISSAQISIGQCFYESEQFAEAAQWGDSLRTLDLSPEDYNLASYLTGASLIRLSRFEEAFKTLEDIKPVHPIPGDTLAVKCTMMQGLSAAFMHKWKTAETKFSTVSEASYPYSTAADFCIELCRRGENFKRKDPTIAGFLAIIPGLGYLYDGYPRTALSAFIINTAFIWGTIDAFSRQNNGLGFTLGVIGFGWYAGNIYGSVTSARRANYNFQQKLLLRFDIGFQF
jgi:putative component of membrane protein insertase Oxa1/YidC/SpoIIIJ protein YidD/tetratricopeptide (TPR) repeat protein